MTLTTVFIVTKYTVAQQDSDYDDDDNDNDDGDGNGDDEKNSYDND